MYTDYILKTPQDEGMILFLENNIRGGKSSIMVDRYVKSDDNEKIVDIDAKNLYGLPMSQPQTIDEKQLK